jgi:hypothetical protein
MLKVKIELNFDGLQMMIYRGAEGSSWGLRDFNYVHILRGNFPHVSGVCSIFFVDVVSDGGKVFVCIVCTVFCTECHIFL